MADTAHEIGVVLLTQHGVPRLDAEVAMLTDPTCRQVGEALVEPFSRFVERVTALHQTLTAAGLLPTDPQEGTT